MHFAATAAFAGAATAGAAGDSNRFSALQSGGSNGLQTPMPGLSSATHLLLLHCHLLSQAHLILPQPC